VARLLTAGNRQSSFFFIVEDERFNRSSIFDLGSRSGGSGDEEMGLKLTAGSLRLAVGWFDGRQVWSVEGEDRAG